MTRKIAAAVCSAILVLCASPVFAKTVAAGGAPNVPVKTFLLVNKAVDVRSSAKPKKTPTCTSPFKWCAARSGNGGICMIGKCPTAQSVQ